MATAMTDTPQFDLSSAVPETDDGKAISAMPAFDLKSAVPEESLESAHPQDNIPEEQAAPLRQQAFDKMKSGIEQIPTSPVSEAVRSFIKNVGKGGLEQFKEADFDYQNASNIPTKNVGESDQDFNKRIDTFKKPLEDAEISKGAIGQLSDTFNMAIAFAAPEMSPKAWATLGTFMIADKTRQAVQNILMPNLTPSEKDVLDLVSFPVEGGMSHEAVTGIGDMISKAFTIKDVSPTIDLTPDMLNLFANPQVTERPAPFVKASQEGWPAPDVETPIGWVSGGILDKLGISENHFDVALNRDMPVRVPITSLFNITKDPQWEDIRQVMNFEGEGGAVQHEGGENVSQGGESIESGSSQEGVSGEEQTGLHLRNDGETKEAGGQEVANQNTQSHRESGNNLDDVTDESSRKEQSQEQKELNKSQQESQPIVDQQSSSKESIPSEDEKGNKISGLAKSVEEDAIHKGLVNELGDLPTYKTRNMEEIAKKVSDFINKDPELAKNIALGDAPEQDGIRSQELFTGLKAKAFRDGDISMIHELGTSEKASAMATELGQRVKALDSGDSENPINIVKDIQKSKEKPTKEIVNDQGKTAKIVAREKEQSESKSNDKWKDFLESIKC